MERSILLIVDTIPKINLVVEKRTKIREIKEMLKNYLNDKTKNKITFFVNSKAQVDVFDTDKYDQMNLESVWEIMNNPRIEIHNSVITLPPIKIKSPEKKEKKRKRKGKGQIRKKKKKRNITSHMTMEDAHLRSI